MSSYLFGSLSDPNIYALYKHFNYFVDLSSDIHWDLNTNKLYVDKIELPDITHGFIRFDVFGNQTNQKYANYYLIKNYLNCNASVYNKDYLAETPYKLYNLMLAKSIGLNIPHTQATNNASTVKETIIKPITGGAHTQIGNKSNYSTIIQQRIKGKNKRLYIINNVPFCFEIISDKIDYREDNKTYVKLSDISNEDIKKVIELMSKLHLNFGAADFMVDKNNKHWFLEINTMPMFAAFDIKTNGLFSKTIHSELVKL